MPVIIRKGKKKLMQTGNEIFDRVNKMIKETPYPMNSLRFSVSYRFAAKVVDLSWSDVLFAITQGFLKHQDAIEHARNMLENNECAQAILDLACISPEEAIFPHSIHPFIDELASFESQEMRSVAQEKIMFVLLKQVFEQGTGIDEPFYDDIINVATIIDHDFSSPKSISHFAGQRSRIVSESNSNEPYIDRKELLSRWKQFLDEQHILWKSN